MEMFTVLDVFVGWCADSRCVGLFELWVGVKWVEVLIVLLRGFWRWGLIKIEAFCFCFC